jgi:hypothetical protein
MTTEILPVYFHHDKDMVSTALWPHVAHLNRVARHLVFIRRSTRLLKFYESEFTDSLISFRNEHDRNPTLEEFALFPEPTVDDIDIAHGLRWIDLEAWRAEALLSEALCALSPTARKVMRSIVADELKRPGKKGSLAEVGDFTDGTDTARYLACLFLATSKIQNLKTWLDVFQKGYVEDHAKRHRTERTASDAGRKSGEVRAAQVRAKPAEVHDAAIALRASGHPSHSIASTIAARFHVSPDHIRRILRSPPI